jgi:hypothetical protein
MYMSAKNHHYIPQTYLRGFSFNKNKSKKQQKVYAFDKSDRKVEEHFVKDICHAEYLYQTETENGDKELVIEEGFSRSTENRFPYLVNKVKERKWLSNPDIADLAMYIASQLLRLPTSLEVIKRIGLDALGEAANKEWAKLLDDGYRQKVMDEFKIHHPDFKHELTRQNVQDIIDGKKLKVEYEIPKNNILITSLEMVEGLAASLLKMGWNFQYAPEGEKFITSDMPVYAMARVDGIWRRMIYGGHELEKAITVFPLNDSICISIANTQYYQDFKTITPEAVKDMNTTTAMLFDKYLIGSSKEIVERFSSIQ